MKKVPEHFRTSMPTAPEVKAVKERKRECWKKRHGQRKTERDMKVNAILTEANAEANVGKNDGATAQLKSPPEKIILGSGKSPTDVMALPSSEADSAASSKPAAGVGKLELGGSDSPFVPIKTEADSAASSKPAAGVGKLELGGYRSASKNQPISASKPSSAGGKRSRSSWEGSIGQSSVITPADKADVITPADKADVKNAQSMGLKRLAKVNKKGMKSLTSFFGASKNKK